jgi:hypothetical protein
MAKGYRITFEVPDIRKTVSFAGPDLNPNIVPRCLLVRCRQLEVTIWATIRLSSNPLNATTHAYLTHNVRIGYSKSHYICTYMSFDTCLLELVPSPSTTSGRQGLKVRKTVLT